jgi:hypothetical protein
MARGNAARHLARLARARAHTLGEGTRSISTVGKGLPPAADEEQLGAGVASFTQKRHRALAARVQVDTQTSSAVPEITTDLYGAVSAVTAEEGQPGVYRNVDGQRFEDGRYKAFTEEISQFIPAERQFTDPVRTFAYGTDASFYRLNPKMVVKVHSEAEIKRVLPIAKRLGVPVTFRAAGTSLSGQAITDSVLLKLSHTGKNFRNYTVHVSGRPAAMAMACVPAATRGELLQGAVAAAAAAIARRAQRASGARAAGPSAHRLEGRRPRRPAGPARPPRRRCASRAPGKAPPPGARGRGCQPRGAGATRRAARGSL